MGARDARKHLVGLISYSSVLCKYTRNSYICEGVGEEKKGEGGVKGFAPETGSLWFIVNARIH